MSGLRLLSSNSQGKRVFSVRAPRLRDCAQVSSILFFHTFLGFSLTSWALRSRLTLPLRSRLCPHALACIWSLGGSCSFVRLQPQTRPPVPLPSHSADPALPLAVPRPHLDVEGVNFIYECNFQAAEACPWHFHSGKLNCTHFSTTLTREEHRWCEGDRSWPEHLVTETQPASVCTASSTVHPHALGSLHRGCLNHAATNPGVGISSIAWFHFFRIDAQRSGS